MGFFHFTYSLHIRSTLLILVIAAAGITTREPLPAQTPPGLPFIQNYRPDEYMAHPQIWDIVQDERGVLYFANSDGIVEFDGEAWRIIPLQNSPGAHSLSIDSGGTIYAGGNGDLGYLSADSSGSLQFVSLIDKIDEKYRDFSLVLNTFATKSGILFRTKKFLFRWANNRMQMWQPPADDFSTSFHIHDRILIRQPGIGLTELKSDSLTLIPGGEMFANRRIYTLLALEDEKILMCSHTDGLFLAHNSSITRFPTQVDNLLIKGRIHDGIILPDGTILLATLQKGIIAIDQSGNLKYFLGKNWNSLVSPILCMFVDRDKSLWLGTNNGISRLEINSPLMTFDERAGLNGTVFDIMDHRNKIYAATDRGIFYLDLLQSVNRADYPPQTAGLFKRVKGVVYSCVDLLSCGNDLLAASNLGTYQISGGKIVSYFPGKPVYVLHQSKQDSNRVFLGLTNGLASLYYHHNRWIDEGSVKGIHEEIRYISETRLGTLWLGSRNRGVSRVKFSGFQENRPGLPEAVITRFDAADGLLTNRENFIFNFKRSELFVNDSGIFVFDKLKQRFIKEPFFASLFPDQERRVYELKESRDGKIWLFSETDQRKTMERGSLKVSIAMPEPDGSYEINNIPFRRVARMMITVIHIDKDGKVWLGGNRGIIRYNPAVSKNYARDFRTIIRRATVKDHQVIYNGFKRATTAPLSVPALSYQNNAIGFEFAAPFFEEEGRNRYQYFLEGFDKEWSNWTDAHKVNYLSLPAGIFQFRVRAKNVYGHIGREDRFDFRILPPWYISWWAFLLYACAFMGIAVLIAKLKSRKLEKRNIELENIIIQRTDEISRGYREIAQKNRQLEKQAQQLQEMDQAKSRFFANISHEFRTPLTLIMGPLEQIIPRENKSQLRTKFKLMLKHARRLLTLINQLLDLSRIESKSLAVQARYDNLNLFIKTMVTSFSTLAEEKKIDLGLIEKQKDIFLYFDPDKLQMILTNLLSNAFKFTPEGGKIEVVIGNSSKHSLPQPTATATSTVPSHSPEFAEIRVRDTGCGIPPQHLDRIFDRFHQVDATDWQGYGGSGIGLALTKELVELHSGEISVKSAPGKGTEFIIRLPMGASPLKQDKIAVGDRKRISPELSYDHLNKEAEIIDNLTETRNDTARERKDSKKSTILLVEDNADMRRFLHENLISDYNIITASNGADGLKRVFRDIPDLVISDLMMPVMDGIELTRKIKTDTRISHVPVILLTAKATIESRIEGFETGADDYLNKPFHIKELMVRVKNLIALRQELKKRFEKNITVEPSEITVSSLDETFLKRSIEIIEQHLEDPHFNVERFSSQIGMTRQNLHSKLKALTNQSPSRFTRSIRLKRAAQLLSKRAGNVSEIAYRVGFENLSYFARCFKEQFGRLPSEYADKRDN